MTEQLYVLQTLLISGLLFTICWRESLWLRVQILAWSVGVIGLVKRFGLSDQLNFYSNDQRAYTGIVRDLATHAFTPDVTWWLQSAKIPYTLPAALLSSIGIEPSLALKVISLLCLLMLTQHVMRVRRPVTILDSFKTLFVTACGGIGVLYSMLALRETMMMLFVTHFVTTRSPSRRAILILLIFLLRPHLAAALILAGIIMILFGGARARRSGFSLGSLAFVILGVFFGYLLFSFGTAGSATGVWQLYGHQWGIPIAYRIASNFFGLQFLTARSETVEFSLQLLLLLRLLLAETVVIPTLFTVLHLTRPHQVDAQSRIVMLAFSIYVGLVTNTDFNSFRQNIPFMTAMGLVILHHTKSRSSSYSVEMSG